MARRSLRALALALVLLALAEAVLTTQAPPRDRTPLPWRGGHEFPWGADLANGVHRTWLGQLVERKRPPGRLRIAVFGSSAVAGVGTTPFHSFPWRLQRRLERRGLDVEVLNLGLSARDTGHHRGAVVRALQELDPSVVVVYAGNNELHRLRVHKHLHPRWTAGWERVRLELERLALYRWLAARFPPQGRSGRPLGLEDIPGNVDSDDRDLAASYHRRNLEGLVEACRAAGVPLVLCTVAANDVARPDYGRPAAPESEAAVMEALAGPSAMQAALARGPEDAHLHHELGMLALENGDPGRARELLDRAREVDPAPRRVLPSWSRIVREVAAERQVTLCDVEERLRERAEGGILGEDLFLDGCHFHPSGNEKVAAVLEAALEAAGLLPEAPKAARAADPGGLEDLGLATMASTPEEYRPLVRELQGIPDPERAVGALAAAAERHPERTALWRDLARAALRTGRFDVAREAAERFLSQGGFDPVVARDLRLLEQGDSR